MSDSLAPANSDDDEVPDYLIAEVINVGEEEAGEEGDLDDSASTVGQSRLGTKRKRRRSKYEIVQASITESQTKLMKLEAALEKAKAAKGYSITDEKRKESIDLAERKVKSQMQVLEAQLETMQHLEATMALATAEAVEKEEQLRVELEFKREIDPECLKLLVTTRIQMDSEFDGKKLKNHTLWPTVLENLKAKMIKAKIDLVHLVSAGAIEKKWIKERDHFRWYCKEVQRYKVSGAPEEDVAKIPTRCAPHDRPHALLRHPLRSESSHSLDLVYPCVCLQSHNRDLREAQLGEAAHERVPLHDGRRVCR